MQKRTEKITEDKFAKNEAPVNPKELLEEIKPLIEDYFLGKVAMTEEGLNYTLPNGQKFVFTAQAL